MAKIHDDYDGVIEHEDLPELWFEYAKFAKTAIVLVPWNLAEIEMSDAILGTEIEDLCGGIAFDYNGIQALKELCEFILERFDFEPIPKDHTP